MPILSKAAVWQTAVYANSPPSSIMLGGELGWEYLPRDLDLVDLLDFSRKIV